jgi:probable phosphoglycerate mutase
MDFIILADGGSRGNPGAAAYGAAVLHAPTETIIAERAGYLGIATNNVAEYNGLVAGLGVVADLRSDARVEVRMDSKLVVEQMSGRWKIKHPDMKTLAIAASKIHPPALVTYVWVPRELNTIADALCNECLDAVALGGATDIARDYPHPA